jgi:hypothetical protein
MRKAITPLGALVRGFAAGAAGGAVIELFLKATARFAPPVPERAFEPPDPEQRAGELPTETIARRVNEGLMKREPLPAKTKKAAGEAVHLLFGSTWGGLYGLARETFQPLGHPLAAAGFGSLVWVAGDLVIVPAFRLGPPPQALPPKNHLFALAGHVLYGLATWAAYEAMRPTTLAAAATAIGALRLHRRLGAIASLRRVVARPPEGVGRLIRRARHVASDLRH